MNKTRENFNTLKIRTKLIILLLAVGLVPIAILGISLGINAHNTVVENRQMDMEKSAAQACVTVDSQADVCEELMRYFAYNSDVIEFLECDPGESQRRDEYYREVRDIVSALKYQNLILETVTIYSDSIEEDYGEEAKSLEELYNQSWYEKWDKKTSWLYDERVLTMVYISKIPSTSDVESYAVVTSDIPTMFQSLEQLAVDAYGVHVEGKEEVWNFSGKDSVNREGIYLSFNRENKEFIWVEEEISKLNLQVFYFTTRGATGFISWTQVIQVSLQVLGCVLIICVLGWLFSNYISSPLERLTEDIQTIDPENMESTVRSGRKDEIGILIKSYNHMLTRIQELIEENYKTKIAQKEFELKALQAQINPHFLYNSLSMINWKAIEAGEPEISKITLALSSFYRTTLNRGQTMNTVKNAVENIQSYLRIQRFMHDDDFQVKYNIDEETYGYYIPLLIFQPFVENALEHGLDVKEDPDHQIWIDISQDMENIHIKICDNGVGMHEEECERILEYDTKGYGVKNVNDRMKLHYGDDYGIKVESQMGMGTTVSLKFPKESEKSMDNQDT